MLIQNDHDIQVQDLIRSFSVYDIILLEGFKDSHFLTKIEVIREGIPAQISCNRGKLKAVITNHKQPIYHNQISFGDIDKIIENFILEKEV